jgi:hypothetical protein
VTEPIAFITGLPRGGTTLTTELLGGLPDCVAIDEPMDRGRFLEGATPPPALGARVRRRLSGTPLKPSDPDPRRIVDNIFAFCGEARDSVKTRGVVISKNVDGSVLGKKVADAVEPDGSRKRLARRSEIEVHKPLSDNFTLFVKHNSAFAGVLPELARRGTVLGVVRNPLAILASWNTVPFAVGQGHATFAELFEPKLARDLNRIDVVADRQLYLLGWFFERIVGSIPRERIVRYEDIISSEGAALRAIHPAADSLRVPLASRNQAKVYDEATMRDFSERLLATDGSYWTLYDRADVLALIP